MLRLASAAACLLLLAMNAAWAEGDGEAGQESLAAGGGDPESAGRRQIQLKRQSTARGTPSESTKTTLRFELFPEEGAFALLRFDLPLPDEKTDFAGSPFNPRLGDIKLRAEWRALPTDLPLAPFLELSLPTADPASLGSGKTQLTAGMKTSWRLATVGAHAVAMTAQLEQVLSVAGDPGRKDINYTKAELGLRDVWRDGYVGKATFKPVADWQQNGKTGATFELEGSKHFSPAWRATLMVGKLLWGEGVPGTYSKRVELTLAHRF